MAAYGGIDTIFRQAGNKVSKYIVPVQAILDDNAALHQTNYDNTANQDAHPTHNWVGRCTYPTIAWTITGIPNTSNQYFYPNLNDTDPVITLKDIYGSAQPSNAADPDLG